LSAGFASNGCGDHSPGGYRLAAALTAEVMTTMTFLLVVNAARRTGAALFVGGWAVAQLWLFRVALNIGGAETDLGPRTERAIRDRS